ncbi:enoyl-CoA hydratase/isomerase family protein [Caballeronia sp. ATUFL_M1_KS5A]|uniref:enoyl-CoA hydratase/isomerase family protein n=1 Tax=Caballeronia sp. ATUFL_M1_KS5A TaxID=2921778 RepID=UPI0020290F0A|nr:enoyl-CoA hydratase/isomerase family protein [Caballeronia sp. ATUFL_M1_KS5A]
MSDSSITLQAGNGIAVLTLNRPDKRNAFTDTMRDEFIAALENVSADQSVRALVLTGAGKGFCAGGDIAGMEKRMNAPAGEVAFNGWARQQIVHKAQMLLHTMPKPVIAAVNGAASGLGADTAIACDFVMASDHASFAWSYIHRGIVADGGGLYFLPRRTGLARAKELIFSGRTVELDEALNLGIADRKTSSETLLDDAIAWATELSRGSSVALALSKSILNQTYELSSEHVFAQGSQAQGICYTSTQHRESVMDFLAKAAARKAQR